MRPEPLSSPQKDDPRTGISEHTAPREAQALLAAASSAELRLLKEERKAEKHLAGAVAMLARDEARLRKAEERVKGSRDAVAAAEASLRETQIRRAAGPSAESD